jgi:sugar lactone lactonase YvrE
MALALAVYGATAEESPPLGRARIAPSVAHMSPGQTQQFKSVMLQTRLTGAAMAQHVTWTVNDVPGGNDEVGRITATGLYTAPAQTPKPREVHIGAEVPDASNHHLWATALFAGEGTAYEFIGEWTESVAHPEHLKNPHCVALDSNGNLVIADYNGSRVHRFTPEGKYLGELSYGVGEGPGYVIKPRVVQADHEGNIFVSDQKKDKPRIQVFSPEGKYLYMFADKGIGPGQILRAHGLVFDSQRRLYVVDVDAMRVNVYSHSGEFLRTWGKDGANLSEFNAPHGIAIDANDDVFVVGYYGPCQKFTSDGTLLRVFAEPDPPDSAVYFHSICSDRWGNIYLMVRGMGGYGGKVEDTDGNHVSIQKFNNNGDYVASLTLNVKGHAENWATVDKNGVVYAIYEGDERMGVERFAPR